VRIDFTLRGLPGRVDIAFERNRDPDELGCPSYAEDFPVCSATVDYAGRGYHALLGWVQLVRSSDGATGGQGFELDPVERVGPVPHPFCWFGFAPTLFDAPSRRLREPMSWTAHSFLAFVGSERHVRALVGFSWGFAIEDGAVALEPPARIEDAGWDPHLALLGAEYPDWAFAPGYHDG